MLHDHRTTLYRDDDTEINVWARFHGPSGGWEYLKASHELTDDEWEEAKNALWEEFDG